MRVETNGGASFLWFAAVGCLGFMLLCLLIGLAGPQNDAFAFSYAYNCNNNTRHAESPCVGGVELTSGQLFVSEIDLMDPLFQYVAVQV